MSSREQPYRPIARRHPNILPFGGQPREPPLQERQDERSEFLLLLPATTQAR